jgi:hypothetical protein
MNKNDAINRLKNRLRNNDSGRQMSEDDLPHIHDLFMCEYGYISAEEFSKIPVPMLNNLLVIIMERKKKELNAMKKGKR